jgi:hypothetical protein
LHWRIGILITPQSADSDRPNGLKHRMSSSKKTRAFKEIPSVATGDGSPHSGKGFACIGRICSPEADGSLDLIISQLIEPSTVGLL